MADANVQLRLLQAVRDGVDWDHVLDYLIQTHPTVVIEAITELNGNDPYRQVLAFAASGEDKVPCIKLLRELNGMGLREAKDWVEANVPQFR